MKKYLLILLIIIMASIAYAGDNVNVEVTYSGFEVTGEVWEEGQLITEFVDLDDHTIIGFQMDYGQADTETTPIDKDKHKWVGMIVKDSKSGFVIHREVIALGRINTRIQNNVAKMIRLPNQEDIGECGDGDKAKLEVCDSDKDCPPITPKCINCQKCGCGSDADCPKITGGPLPCGSRGCPPHSRPRTTAVCNRFGDCVSKVLHCYPDPTCMNETIDLDPEKMKQMEEEWERKKSEQLKEPEQDTEELEDLKSKVENVNKGLESAPDFVKSLLEEENINIYAGEIEMHALTRYAFVYAMGYDEYPEPTLLITTDEETVEKLLSGEMDLLTAYENDLIDVDGVGFFKNLKISIMEFISGFFI
ncbi:hypothetical protein KY331_05925 [Candidatus Woesearchaeota archaeon]|nr:hypothetical protein [Candidatus Woesearchaeota archaeon]